MKSQGYELAHLRVREGSLEKLTQCKKHFQCGRCDILFISEYLLDPLRMFFTQFHWACIRL